jgi:hypothetical protein
MGTSDRQDPDVNWAAVSPELAQRPDESLLDWYRRLQALDLTLLPPSVQEGLAGLLQGLERLLPLDPRRR